MTDTLIPSDQDTRGRFLPGNKAAAKHLQRVPRDRWPAWLTEEAEALYQSSLADDGGGDIPARRLAVHRYRAETHALILALLGGLKHHGPTDRHGRLRSEWLRRFEALVALARSLDQTLGLDRRSRDVTSLDAYLDAPETPAQTPPAAAWGATDTQDRELIVEPGAAPDAATETGEGDVQ